MSATIVPFTVLRGGKRPPKARTPKRDAAIRGAATRLRCAIRELEKVNPRIVLALAQIAERVLRDARDTQEEGA
jgi:hypothetical protein